MTGGFGATSSITGTSLYYAGGGGGSSDPSFGYGNGGNTPQATSGGGARGQFGDGPTGFRQAGFSGTVNTGGGGASSTSSAPPYFAGGSGGSGIVIISYPSTSADLTTIGAGLTYTKTTSGGNTIYTFTAGTGTVTV
jgi:hypothetical protein